MQNYNKRGEQEKFYEGLFWKKLLLQSGEIVLQQQLHSLYRPSSFDNGFS